MKILKKILKAINFIIPKNKNNVVIIDGRPFKDALYELTSKMMVTAPFDKYNLSVILCDKNNYYSDLNIKPYKLIQAP